MKDIINQFVGMNAETRRRTITAVIVAIADFLSVFNIITFNDAQMEAIKNLVLVVVTGFVWFYCSHYKNNDFTEASVHGTGITRQIKREQEADYVGDRFYTNVRGELLGTEDDEYDEPEHVDGTEMAAEELAAEMKAAEDKED